MLVLTRKAGEAILIGDNIRVVVVRVEGKHARIAIDAPGIHILREEVQRREQKVEQATEESA